MQVVSAPTPEYEYNRNLDHLWLLVGGGPDYHDGATAYYLGNDRDIDGDDLASDRISETADEHSFDKAEALDALARYRDSI